MHAAFRWDSTWPDSLARVVRGFCLLAILCAMLGAVLQPAAAQHPMPSDDREIVQVLRATFDRPEAPLAIAPVVVVGDHAVAGWVQDKRGGRALMRKQHGKWTIHLCSGDQIKHADILESTGIPTATAKTLAERLAVAERAMPRDTVALFATFEGIVHLGADGSHPPVHEGQHHPKHK